MMNYPNQAVTVGGKMAVPAVESEISTENRLLGQAIQSAFENVRQLAQRLQPVLRPENPEPGQGEKSPELPSSELGDSLRSHKKSVEGIASTIQDLLNALAI